MVDQIRTDATFKVPSKIYSYDYTWKLSRWIMKGAHGRKKSLFFDLSVTFRNLYYLKNRFFQKKKKNSFYNAFCHPQVASGILNILIFPLQILYLLIGLPKKVKNYYTYVDSQKKLYNKLVQDDIVNPHQNEEEFQALFILDSKDTDDWKTLTTILQEWDQTHFHKAKSQTQLSLQSEEQNPKYKLLFVEKLQEEQLSFLQSHSLRAKISPSFFERFLRILRAYTLVSHLEQLFELQLNWHKREKIY